ncbi:hypothetical protein Tco_1052073, partial [Tanacetum coccineum]
MMEGASIEDHVNEFNSIISRLLSVEIKFDDEVHAMLLLSSLPESWSGTIITVSGSIGNTKLTFDNICDLIHGEDIRRKTFREYSNSLLSVEEKGRGRKQDRGQKQKRGQLKSKKRASKDKEVNMAARYSNDASVCCVVNMIGDRIMDSHASFHATYFKEELERFRLCCGKNLKDVRYIPGLKRRLIFVGQLDEEGYHIGFIDQQRKVTKGSLAVACQNKRGSLYMIEVPSDGINKTIDGRSNATLHANCGTKEGKLRKVWEYKETIEATTQMRWDIPFGVQRVTMSYEAEMSHLMRTFFTESSNLTGPNQKGQVVLEDCPDNLANNS